MLFYKTSNLYIGQLVFASPNYRMNKTNNYIIYYHKKTKDNTFCAYDVFSNDKYTPFSENYRYDNIINSYLLLEVMPVDVKSIFVTKKELLKLMKEINNVVQKNCLSNVNTKIIKLSNYRKK